MFSDLSEEWNVPQKGVKLDKQLFHFSKKKKSMKKSHENLPKESNSMNASISSTMLKSFEQLDADELQKKKRIRKRKNKNKFKPDLENISKKEETDNVREGEDIVVTKKKKKRKLEDNGDSPSPKKKKKVDITKTESVSKNEAKKRKKIADHDTAEPVIETTTITSSNKKNKKKKKVKSIETETEGKKADCVQVLKTKDSSETADDQSSKALRYREKKRRRKERLRALREAGAGVENSSQIRPQKSKVMNSGIESNVEISLETKLSDNKPSPAEGPLKKKKQKRKKSKSEKMEMDNGNREINSSPTKSNKKKSELQDVESFPRSPLLKSEILQKIDEMSPDKSTPERTKSLGSKKKFSLGLKKILETERAASREKPGEGGRNKQDGLKGRMEEKLSAARFRFLNEQLYTTTGAEAYTLFHQDPDSYQVYHRGYSSQVEKWPTNPCDVIIHMIRNMPGSPVVADFGCGEAKIARSLPNKVHSFDLKAACDDVIECNMAKVPLPSSSVDVAVFCLSLMGTDLVNFLAEGNRVLKQGGCLLIAEVRSRFTDLKHFLKGVQKLGFKLQQRDLSNKMFVLLKFGKVASVDRSRPLPYIELSPCLYKKR